VSFKIAKAMDLRDVLEAILHLSMEAVSAKLPPLFRPLAANPETGLLSPPIVYGRPGNFFKNLFSKNHPGIWDPCMNSPYNAPKAPKKSFTRFVECVHASAKGIFVAEGEKSEGGLEVTRKSKVF
jgi:hypothetical protein